MTKLNNKGFISIYSIMWMVVLFPLLMFVAIDLSYYTNQFNRLKNITDNAAASAITAIQENEIPKGNLVIDENEAINITNNILKKDLLLNDDMSPKENSNLKFTPKVDIKIVNDVPTTGLDITTKQGNIKVYNPCVIVSAEYKVKGLFYNKSVVTFNKIGVSQVQFK